MCSSQLILADSINAHELRLEDERRATGDRANSTVTVTILRRNSQGALLSDAHIEQTLVPSRPKEVPVSKPAHNRRKQSIGKMETEKTAKIPLDET